MTEPDVELRESDGADARRRARFVLLAEIAAVATTTDGIGRIMKALGPEADASADGQIMTGVQACSWIAGAYRRAEDDPTRLDPLPPIIHAADIGAMLCRIGTAPEDERIGKIVWQPNGGTQFVPDGAIGEIVQDGLEALRDKRPVGTCVECERRFVSLSGAAVYCSTKCRNNAAVRASRARRKAERP